MPCFTGIIGTLGARFVWENGMHYALYSLMGAIWMAFPKGRPPRPGWPTWIVYAVIPMGSYLMCFRFLQVAVSFLRTGELPHHDHGHVDGLDEDEAIPAPGQEDAVYAMKDNLHPAMSTNRGPSMNSIIILSLLVVLMLTGMPVSISLGLTVLSFLFFMTEVPIESVALKLFTGIEKFEIMAIPFFILAGNFPHPWGVARRMISSPPPWWGIGTVGWGWVVCWPVRCLPRCRVRARLRWWPWFHSDASHGQGGIPQSFGAGVITTSGALGILIPPSIVMVMYSVSTNTSVGALFMAGVVPGLLLAFLLGLTTWYRAKKFDYPRQPKAKVGASAGWRSQGHLGFVADRGGHGRYLHRHLHPTRGRRHERRVCLCGGGVRVQGHGPQGRAPRAACFGQHERHAALHHHECGALLVLAHAREHSATDGRTT